MTVVLIDEGYDLVLQVAQQVIVTHQEPSVQRLTPELDLARCLRIMQGVADMNDFLIFQPFSHAPHESIGIA